MEPLAADCPACPLCLDWQWDNLDLPSLALGLLVGLLLGPVVDIIQLLRQSWRVWLATRLKALEKPEGAQSALYKLL